jgi:hypothetical protein
LKDLQERNWLVLVFNTKSVPAQTVLTNPSKLIEFTYAKSYCDHRNFDSVNISYVQFQLSSTVTRSVDHYALEHSAVVNHSKVFFLIKAYYYLNKVLCKFLCKASGRSGVIWMASLNTKTKHDWPSFIVIHNEKLVKITWLDAVVIQAARNS